MFDVLLRNATLVRPDGIIQADVGVSDGKIAALAAELSEEAKTEVNAAGLHVFPGLVDTHVHFNEPGRAHWEGFRSGSRAFAAGGGSVFADMPLNSEPPLLTRQAFHDKLLLAKQKSLTDFALWGGLTPDSLEQLPELAELGVIGFKAFMCDSGIESFQAVDDVTLLKGMQLAKRLGLPVAVHAESQAITQALRSDLRGSGGTQVRDYLASRPIIAELEAINRVILFAQETGCDVHVVHVSNARGLTLIADARMRGIRVTAETCPHYLHFTSEDAGRLGASLKCSPPVRNNNERHALWQALLRGEVSTIGSDHSPSSPDLKTHNDFFEVWGGIPGVQSSLQVLLTHRQEQGLPLAFIAALTAAHPAERFKLPNKGRLEVGYDADFCLVDINASQHLTPEDLHYQHKISPYVGETLRGRVHQTYVRGQRVFHDGVFSSNFNAQFIRPDNQHELHA